MSEELENVTDGNYELDICGKKRKLIFDFSAWARLEEMYGSLDNLDNIEKEIIEKPFTVIPKLIYVALEDKDGVDENNVLKGYYPKDLENVTKTVLGALYYSLPATTKKKLQKTTMKE